MTRSTTQRIVITGAAGFIGSHLAETLLDRDYEVIGIDNLLTGDTANLSHLVNRDFTFIKHDVTNYLHVDGRNLYEPDRLAKFGFTYDSIGRRLACASS